ncbi:DNA helicase [Tanacetum coccineum]
MVGATFSSSESISHSGSRLPPAQASIRGVVEPDSRAASLGPPSGYRSVGKCEHSCKHCGALFWYEEQIEHSARYAHQSITVVVREVVLRYGLQPDVQYDVVSMYNVVGAREYELPIGDMLGAIVGPETEMEYDIIIKERSGYPQRVNKLHPSYMSLQFPLLFLYGEDGYSNELNLVGGAGSSNADKRLTMKAYYVYFIHDRANYYNYLSTTGRLFQQYVVIAFCAIESNRIDFICEHQNNIRNEYMSGIYDDINRGDSDGSDCGARLILPQSFTVTEYTAELPQLTTTDCPDIVDRVFEMKIHQIATCTAWGKTINEFHDMLKLHEQTLPKNNAPALHAIRAGKVQKVNKHEKPQPQMAARGQNQGRGKNKLAYAPKPKIPPLPKREDPVKDSICHECG